MLTKYAEVSTPERNVEVLDAFAVPSNAGHKRLARMRRRAHRHHFEYSPRPGYIYVRSRAISSRCNDNFDEFPAAEIKKAYATFVGKPVFVNHHNADHRRARGVIIDAALHEDTNPDGTEDTWAEVLMEVDAVRFPVLAREVLAGNIARTSMGTDVEYSECTACGNRAATPADYCQHIPKMKGMKVRRPIIDAQGKVAGTEEVLVAERCYGLGFFENSLLVEDPADPTAFVLGVHDGNEGLSRAAAKAVIDEAETITRSAAKTAAPVKTKADFLGDYKSLGVNHVWDFDKHPLAESMESYGFRFGNDVIESGNYDRDDFNSFHEEVVDVPLSQIRYKRQQSHVIHPYVEYLAGIPQSQFNQNDLPYGQRMPDGTVLLMEGHHRSAAASLRGDRALKMVVYGIWGQKGKPKPTSPQPRKASGDRLTTVDGLKPGTLLWYRNPAAGSWIDVAVANDSPGPGKVTIIGDARTGFHRTLDDDDLANGYGLRLREHGNADDAIRRQPPKAASAVEALLRAEAGQCVRCNPRLAATGSQILCDSHAFQTEHGTVDFGTSTMHAGETMDFGRISSHRTAEVVGHQHTAYGETKAPAKVDTMRAENCPVCGDDEGYNGDKCSVCGYAQPPSQFTDPDLTKARENDLRQEQADAGLPTQTGLEPAPEGEDLTCDSCGEVFSAQGEAAPGEADPADPTDPTAVPAEDPAADPAADETLDDLADVDDDDLFADDEDDTEEPDETEAKDPAEKIDEGVEEKVDEEISDKVEDEALDPDAEDPLVDEPDPFLDGDDEADEDPAEGEETVDEISSATDPAVGEGRITAEPEASTETTLDTPVAAGSTCPVCGEGTLNPPAATVTTDGTGEPPLNEVGTDPTKKKAPVHSARAVQKEASTDMGNTPTTPANPAQQRRSLMVAAIREQQATIQTQANQIRSLTHAVASLAAMAGVGKHPHFAGLVRQAGLKVADADTNAGDSIGGTPATTTEEAAKPDATDDVESIGAAPAPANTGVTPEAVTDVNNSDVAANPPVLDNLQSVTQPVAGTDAPTPAAGDAAGTSTVTVGTPSNETFDKPEDSGWTASKADPMQRFVAAQRLARLRISAGIETGDDITIAQRIAASEEPLGEIVAQVTALSAVASRQQVAPPRHLVPRAAGRTAGIQPSMASTGTDTDGLSATASREGEDVWLVGGDVDFNLDS